MQMLIFQLGLLMNNWAPILTGIPSGVNLINILCKPCAPIFLRQKKLQSQNVTREKLHEALSYEKHARKMLMKLTIGQANNLANEDMDQSALRNLLLS